MRAYVAPWRQDVTCPSCRRVRSISARHQYYFDRAALRPCRGCQPTSRGTWNGIPIACPTTPAAKRYQPDEAVVDWVIVDRLMSGQYPADWRASERAERVAAVAALTALGMPAAAIAVRLKVSVRTVVRLRQTIREAAGHVA